MACHKGRKDWSYNLKMFCRYPVHVILVAVVDCHLTLCIFLLDFFGFTKKDYLLISAKTVIKSFRVCLQINCLVTDRPVHLDWDSWFFTIPICTKITEETGHSGTYLKRRSIMQVPGRPHSQKFNFLPSHKHVLLRRVLRWVLNGYVLLRSSNLVLSSEKICIQNDTIF